MPLHPMPAEENGTKLYASCISFQDDVPPLLACRHPCLAGAKATKAVCLLSSQPYLHTMEQVGRMGAGRQVSG